MTFVSIPHVFSNDEGTCDFSLGPWFFATPPTSQSKVLQWQEWTELFKPQKAKFYRVNASNCLEEAWI